jgi:hypothetical protein
MQNRELIFSEIKANCCMGNTYCICTHDERVVRGYVRGEITMPMTEQQREYCISTADWAGEGHYNRKELSEMNDKDLATALLNAWMLYAQSMY